jgi:hypothetical protein
LGPASSKIEQSVFQQWTQIFKYGLDAMPRMTYEAIQKQIAKLQAQAVKMESDRGAAKKKSIAKVMALMKQLGISVEDLKGAEPRSSTVWRRDFGKGPCFQRVERLLGCCCSGTF